MTYTTSQIQSSAVISSRAPAPCCCHEPSHGLTDRWWSCAVATVVVTEKQDLSLGRAETWRGWSRSETGRKEISWKAVGSRDGASSLHDTRRTVQGTRCHQKKSNGG